MCPTENNIEFHVPMLCFNILAQNMSSNRNVLAKRFILEDEDSIGSLDKSPNITLDHWNINIVKLFSQKEQAFLSVKLLMEMVVSYKLSLSNKALLYTYAERFSSRIIHHLNFIHECFNDLEYHRINLLETTNYYSMLEDVLAIYCSVELKIVSKICFKSDSNNNEDYDKIVMTDEMMYLKRLSQQAQKMSFILHNFLRQNENVLHVLMKMWYNRESASCVVTVRYLYILLLYDEPITNKSDESYCRYMINYLLWILIERNYAASNIAESMIGVLNKKFGIHNNKIPDSPFIRKVLNISGDLLDFVNTIQIQSSTIEKYFVEIKKNQQSRIFHDSSDNPLSFESYLDDLNDDEDISNKASDRDFDSECSDSDSDNAFDIANLESGIIVIDDDEDEQVISSNNGASSSHGTARAIHDEWFTFPLTASFQSDTTTAAKKAQRPPHIDSVVLQAILQTVADVVRKSQSANSEQGVCANCESVTDTNSDISDRFAVKRALVRSRRRSSGNCTLTIENRQNLNLSPQSTSTDLQDSRFVPETPVPDDQSPNYIIETSICDTIVKNHIDPLNILNEQSLQLDLCTSTPSENSDMNSELSEDHDSGQKENKRGLESTTNASKPSPQSTQSPEHINPIIAPSIILKVIILNKVPPVELNEPEYTSENGVKGLVGLDIALLGHQATEIEHTAEILHFATKMTHTEYIQDKAFVEIVTQEVEVSENRSSTVQTPLQYDSEAEEHFDNCMNSIHNKEDLTETCTNLLLPNDCGDRIEDDIEDQYLKSMHSISTQEVQKICENLLISDDNELTEVRSHRTPHYDKEFNFPNSSLSAHISDDEANNVTAASPSTTPNDLEELTPEEEEALNKLLRESMAHMYNSDSEENGTETRLPFKKRRMSDSSKTDIIEIPCQTSKRKKRNSRNRKHPNSCLWSEPSLMKDFSPEISYPATKMISIAELQEQTSRRSIKTAAERKEVPVNVPTNIVSAATSAFTPYYPCHINRSGTVSNAVPLRSVGRSSLVDQLAYPYASAELPPPLSAAKHFQAVASAYYARAAADNTVRFRHGSYSWQYHHWNRGGSVE